MDSSSLVLRVATYNIRNICDQYEKREQLLMETVKAVSADVIGLQEVENGQLPQLCGNDEKIYDAYTAPIQTPWCNIPSNPELRIDCNAVLLKKNANETISNLFSNAKHSIVHLSPTRNAQLLQLSSKLYIVNTHLHHVVEEQQIRLVQMRELLRYLRLIIPDYDKAIVIVLGDLNAQPNEPCIQLINEGEKFKSAYFEFHKKHPDVTFPTGLQGPYMDTDPPGCFDYIFYKGEGVQVEDAVLFGEQVHPNYSTVYPSDHLGVLATFSIKFNDSQGLQQ